MLTGSQVGIGWAPGRDCSIYDGWRDQPKVRFCHVFGPPSLNDCLNNAPSLDSLPNENC
jgi:hypothetical protein